MFQQGMNTKTRFLSKFACTSFLTKDKKNARDTEQLRRLILDGDTEPGFKHQF
jgi:hypothetical protein